MAAPDIDDLVVEILGGKEAAWRDLWQAVEPTLHAMLRRPNLLGPLSRSEDDCHNIVVEVMARLRADRFARLSLYAEAKRDNHNLRFMRWLLVVAKRVAIDYLRAHETYIDRRHVKDASAPGAWRAIVTLPNASELPGARPSVTRQGTAHELLAFVDDDLPDAQRTALVEWLQGASFDDIAAGGDAKDAAKRVRAALERIRRRFREQEP